VTKCGRAVQFASAQMLTSWREIHRESLKIVVTSTSLGAGGDSSRQQRQPRVPISLPLR
jgi:hypothetical protein